MTDDQAQIFLEETFTHDVLGLKPPLIATSILQANTEGNMEWGHSLGDYSQCGFSTKDLSLGELKTRSENAKRMVERLKATTNPKLSGFKLLALVVRLVERDEPKPTLFHRLDLEYAVAARMLIERQINGGSYAGPNEYCIFGLPPS